MTALYDQLNAEQLEETREFIKRSLKQDTLTTGDIEIDEDGNRFLTDVHAQFVTNGVEAGDTLQTFPTTPASIQPVGDYEIVDVVDENTIEFSGEALPLGTHISYRVISTSGLQLLLNSQYSNLSTIVNVDIAEALRQEQINVPWYSRSTNIVLNYMYYRGALLGGVVSYPIDQAALDRVTLNPRPALGAPFTTVGPELFSFFYNGLTPDRRGGGVSSGLGAPILIGNFDSFVPVQADSGDDEPDPVVVGIGELNGLQQEKIFYDNRSSISFPTPGYSAEEEARLTSIKDAQESALIQERDFLDTLMILLDEELTDLRERGVTKTQFYAAISASRGRMQAARDAAEFARTDPDKGLPAITTSGQPTTDRTDFIEGQRLNEVNERISRLPSEYAVWLDQRYVFLSRRVHRVRGSLTKLRIAQSRAGDIQAEIKSLGDEQVAIDDVFGTKI
jgi:hypothetical protein